MAKELIAKLSDEQLHCLKMMRKYENDAEEYGKWEDNLKKITEVQKKEAKDARPWIVRKLDDISGDQVFEGITTAGMIMLVFFGKDALEKYWDPVAGSFATRRKKH